LDGNIETPHLSIEDGATFNGSVSMKAANKSGNVASIENAANQGGGNKQHKG
jgi:cytoskeletal protein CcmA (bactofilin family)